jgi:hypothetical protein
MWFDLGNWRQTRFGWSTELEIDALEGKYSSSRAKVSSPS